MRPVRSRSTIQRCAAEPSAAAPAPPTSTPVSPVSRRAGAPTSSAAPPTPTSPVSRRASWSSAFAFRRKLGCAISITSISSAAGSAMPPRPRIALASLTEGAELATAKLL
eukprot:7303075-Prymnesium_polylepis.2